MKRWVLFLIVCQVAAGCVTATSVPFRPLSQGATESALHLYLPERPTGRVAAVVLVHGTAGPDSRYDWYRSALLDAGFAVAEVDFKTGVFTDSSDRPPTDHFLPHAFGVLKALQSNARIDPKRIAIMGFSLGAMISYKTAKDFEYKNYLRAGEPPFAAHIALYPVCGSLYANKMKRWVLFLIVCQVAAGCVTATSVPFRPLSQGATESALHLYLPERPTGRVAAVVLVHGTAGPDSRYDWYRSALLDAGFAVAEVDFKTGVFTDSSDRPPTDHFLPHAFGVLKALQSNARIDPKRIAIMGFSLGAMISYKTAKDFEYKNYLRAGEPPFAAHIALYPVCGSLYANKMTERPVMILVGELDTYGAGRSCPYLVKNLNQQNPGLAQIKIYNGVHHGFDRPDPPYWTNGETILEWDGDAAEDSRQRIIAFLRKHFGTPR